MTLKIYIGTASEINDRFSGAPSSTTTTVATVTSKQVFTLTSATSFSAGDSIVIGQQKGIIDTLVGVTVTLESELISLPTVGQAVSHYNADYSVYRDASQSPLVFVNDRETGGGTGDSFGQDLILIDWDGEMATPQAQSRISIFDSDSPSVILFGGVITAIERVVIGKGSNLCYGYRVFASGYLKEADSVGIEEPPVTNVNAGKYLQYLMEKYTNLTAGDIDTTNSPTVDYIRLGNFRRFSDIGQALAGLWPGSEFFIENGQSGGLVYFRQKASTSAPFQLTVANLERWGAGNCQIKEDYEKVFNIVRFPYYQEYPREPDLHVQDTVSDAAFLRTTVTLAGQPSTIEESVLLFDDFKDGSLDTDFTEDDLTNSSPPDGFNSADGYLVEGTVNDVEGLHFLDTSAVSPSYGDIGRVTDPGETEPFTGEERQALYIQEMVVSTAGDLIFMGIVDQSTVTTTVLTGSTTSAIQVASTTGFVAGDRIAVDGEKTYVASVGSGVLNVSPGLSGAPSVGDAVTLHRLAKSRIKFALELTSGGDLKYIKNGVSTAFGTPRTYTTDTYSFRIFMQSFETTVASGISSTGCTLTTPTNFSTGDVVEIYTRGGRELPEKRVIAVSGSTITYTATDYTPSVGYRVRTLPKITVQVKGGTYGTITARSWATIHTEANTWQSSATSNRDDHGILLALHKSVVGTLPLFQMRNPPGITGNIGGRYLHIGTQEVESSEPDIDCIVRKVGSHFQLAFFPDSKSLWASGETLELRYKERWRNDLEMKDEASIQTVARQRGLPVSDSDSETVARRKGGKVLDTVEILPSPLSDTEAINQAKTILNAAKDPAFTVSIVTNSHNDGIPEAGQTITSTIDGVPNLEIQTVRAEEIPGTNAFQLEVQAGTVDRLKDAIQKREIKSGQRLVIDDGRNDDSFTRITTGNLSEEAVTSDQFETETCDSPTRIVYDGAIWVYMRCLEIA